MEVTKAGFLVCPKCGKKTNTKVLPETIMQDFPLYCNRCREAFRISYQGFERNADTAAGARSETNF